MHNPDCRKCDWSVRYGNETLCQNPKIVNDTRLGTIGRIIKEPVAFCAEFKPKPKK